REYDAWDRVTKVIDPDGVVSATATYKELGTVVANALGKRHAVLRDASGATLRSESQDENGVLKGQVTYTYGPFGVIEHTIKELNHVAVDLASEYDPLGRKTRVQDPDRGETRFAVNGFGEVIHQRDAAGQVETRRYDLLGRIRTVLNADGTTT